MAGSSQAVGSTHPLGVAGLANDPPQSRAGPQPSLPEWTAGLRPEWTPGLRLEWARTAAAVGPGLRPEWAPAAAGFGQNAAGLVRCERTLTLAK
jgi:hypothetical protein